MTLEEFLDKHREIVTADLKDQVLAAAWFLRRHEGQSQFTMAGMGDRIKKVGIDSFNVPSIILKLCNEPTKKLQIEDRFDERTSYYGLLLPVLYELDAKYRDCLSTASTIATTTIIAGLPKQYSSLIGCPYWDELALCYGVRAYRASVIMMWNLIYNRLCDFILADSGRLSAFNQKCSKTITNRDDFTDLKEFDVITWAKTSGAIVPNVQVILNEKLKRRNMFAHASGMKPIPHEVDAYIVDLVTNVLPRL
jgi:hypothetical protein